MEQASHYASIGGLIAVFALWLLFASTFLMRRKPEATTDRVKIPNSFIGLILQLVAYLPVFMIGRTPFFSAFIEEQYLLNTILQVVAIALAAASVWLAMSAVRELGKQWSLQARLVEGHKLITTGPYNIVRHPIYTAMLGMLIATGIVYSYWWTTVAGVAIFIVGTKIRTVSEEKLLTDAFGAAFTDWKVKVPGLIPFVKL
ncbi:MAG: isoprenylcysteine carboxylmethyltransferase family protein [Pyrinomonadaceae bacterium]